MHQTYSVEEINIEFDVVERNKEFDVVEMNIEVDIVPFVSVTNCAFCSCDAYLKHKNVLD